MSQQSKRPHVKRTAFAQQAVDFSDYFDMLFEKIVVEGDAPRKPTLVAPDGMSTGGGKQGRQHLVLKADDDVVPAVPVGWVDRGQGMVSLRTYECLVDQYRQRKKPFDLDQESYETFFNKAKDFFTREKMPVKVESAVRPSVAAPAAPVVQEASSNRGMLALVFVLLFLLAVAISAAVFFAFD